MAKFNTWLPGGKSFFYGTGTTIELKNRMHFNGSLMLTSSFIVTNAQSGFGITSDMADPFFEITVPPKVCYACDVDFIIGLKDSDNWIWEAQCPNQPTLRERGWEWAQFSLAAVQEAGNANLPLPAQPSAGNIQSFQFRGAENVHGSTNDIPHAISIAYLAGRTPVAAANGDIRTFKLTNESSAAHNWKVGDVSLFDGTRREIKYYGALPFGFQSNGPRDRLAALPYRGPLIAGYQSGTPWVGDSNNAKLGGVLDFCLEAQNQFRMRSPKNILGPFMHCYLIATWDCEQNGQLDTWVWDAPDGNPAWNGWQYRAFDSLAHTWYAATKNSMINTANRNKAKLICERFLTWLYEYMEENPKADYIPSEWGPPGWSQGQPLPPNSYLDPRGTARDSHDMALALKGAIFCALAGADAAVCRVVIRRLVQSIVTTQVNAPTDVMRGAFTLKPQIFEVYGFHQGEVMDALGLALANPQLLK